MTALGGRAVLKRRVFRARADIKAPAAISRHKSPPHAEGAMEGVVVTAHKDGSIVSVSVTSDAKGHYAFPENRLEPGHYTLAIRAVGYDLAAPAATDVAGEKTTNVDLKLDKTKNLASQLTNAEWMMSIPGTEEQKAFLLNCTSCHTLERIVRSTHDADEWTQVVIAHDGLWRGEPAGQAAADARSCARRHAGAISQDGRISRHHQSERGRQMAPIALKTLPRPTGRATHAIVTEYDVGRDDHRAA